MSQKSSMHVGRGRSAQGAGSSKEGQAVTVHCAIRPCLRPLLLDSFYALKREAAPGVDGMTWKAYETDLDKRVEDWHSRVHRGALPSKRAYIPKPDGRQHRALQNREASPRSAG